jgi:hypothetical protein
VATEFPIPKRATNQTVGMKIGKLLCKNFDQFRELDGLQV